jgi:hypothetical protein
MVLAHFTGAEAIATIILTVAVAISVIALFWGNYSRHMAVKRLSINFDSRDLRMQEYDRQQGQIGNLLAGLNGRIVDMDRDNNDMADAIQRLVDHHQRVSDHLVTLTDYLQATLVSDREELTAQQLAELEGMMSDMRINIALPVANEEEEPAAGPSGDAAVISRINRQRRRINLREEQDEHR